MPSPTRLLLACLLAPAPAAAQTTAAVLDSVFREWRSTQGPGCTVGVDSAGIRTTRAYGMANLEYRVPLGPGSVIESGSVAKQFTAATVALLAQRGKLSLDDDIRRYLPEVPDFGATITIRHLLQHTSGLRDQWGLLGLQGFPPGQEVHTLARILDLVAHQRRLNFAPGAEYLYSNTGYALAAIIVQRVTGELFARFSEEQLFKPIGMLHTQWRDDYRRVVADRATAYAPAPDGWIQDMPFTNVHGNGGLLTTVDDLLTWNDALTTGRIPGGTDLVRLMETPGKLNDGSAIRYGLGLTVGTFRGVRVVGHNGATAGYRTNLARYPERGLSVAVLCNVASANTTAYLNQIAGRLLRLPAVEAAPGPTVALAADSLAGLAGAYRDSTSDDRATFAVVDGGLVLTEAGPAATLVHLGGLRFWHPQAGEFRFERRADRWEVVHFDQAWRRYRPSPAVDPTTVPAADYVGDYRSPELEVTYRVVTENGVLVLRSRPDGRQSLRPVYPDGFEAAGRTIRFTRDARGRPNGFRVFAGRVRDVRFERLAAR